MALTNIKGRDIGLAIQKDVAGTPTYVRVGCITDSTLNVDLEADEATCTASGQWKEFIGGQSSFTVDGTLNVRQASSTDAASNVTAENLADLILSGGAPVQVQYSIGQGTGAVLYTGLAIPTKCSFKGQNKGIATFSISLQGTGALTKTLAP